MATLKDVARLAEVSIATASGALNHHPHVKASTRKRVVDAAAVLKYRPNGVARDLKTQRTETIVVFLHDLGGPFYSELVRGIQDVAMNHGYAAIASWRAGEINTAWNRLLVEGRVDGAIILDPSIADWMINASVSENLPIILLDRKLETPFCYHVAADHEAGAYQATKHLLDLGLKTVAFISGPLASHDSVKRFKGYQRALDDYRLSVDGRFVLHGNFTEQGGYLAAEAIVSQGMLPEGIFAANDEMAIGVLAGLKAKGISVPDDILLVGFDDIRLAQYVTPGLTTVRQPMYELGAIATEVLFKAFQGERNMPPVMLPTELIVRNSTQRA